MLFLNKNAFSQKFTYNECTFSIYDNLTLDIAFNSLRIFPEYYSSLDSLATFLLKNPNLSIIVENNSDSRGSNEFLLKHTEKRAEAVVLYLISKGIEKERLSYKGNGENEPRILMTDIMGVESKFIFVKGTILNEEYINELNDGTEEGKKKFEDAHRLNRRTVIRITDTIYYKNIIEDTILFINFKMKDGYYRFNLYEYANTSNNLCCDSNYKLTIFKTIGLFKDSLPHGIWKMYWPNGNIYKTVKFDKGSFTDTMNVYYPDGKLWREIIYNNKRNKKYFKKVINSIRRLNMESEYETEFIEKYKILISYTYKDKFLSNKLFYSNGKLKSNDFN